MYYYFEHFYIKKKLSRFTLYYTVNRNCNQFFTLHYLNSTLTKKLFCLLMKPKILSSSKSKNKITSGMMIFHLFSFCHICHYLRQYCSVSLLFISVRYENPILQENNSRNKWKLPTLQTDCWWFKGKKVFEAETETKWFVKIINFTC